MKNSIYLKRIIIIIIFLFFFVFSFFLKVNSNYYKEYTKNYNTKYAVLLSKIKEKYPLVTSQEISSIINEENIEDLSKYGIDIEDESIIIENDKLNNKRTIIEISTITIFCILIIVVVYYFNKKKNKDIYNIANMIEEVCNGNYTLDFESKNEDELSKLKDSLYKITLKLKEERDISLNDKKLLKENLENISHQLKTPLTVISISIDNILDNEKITEKKKKELLIGIRK